MWSFQFLDNILQDPNQPTSSNKEQNHLNTVSDLEAHKIFDETILRIGPPNENLIRHRANLLEQLEIEAEFEDNIEKVINSEANIKPIDKNLNQTAAPPVTVDSADNVLFKDLFIAQTQYDVNDTSRGSQTNKTSLGKKSKLRKVSESQPESSNAPYNDQEQQDKELLDKLYMNKDFEINNENVDCITVPLKDESPSHDDEYDHERN